MRPPRIEPGPGQESVWDYPRPPSWQPCSAHITVFHHDLLIAETRSAIRILETSQPPAFYIPHEDVNFAALTPSRARSFCEWKGEASYFDLAQELTENENQIEQVGWSYPRPNNGFEPITNRLAFYAQKLSCTVAGEEVVANDGTFYGGWITSKVVGPFKGGPGSSWW